MVAVLQACLSPHSPHPSPTDTPGGPTSASDKGSQVPSVPQGSFYLKGQRPNLFTRTHYYRKNKKCHNTWCSDLAYFRGLKGHRRHTHRVSIPTLTVHAHPPTKLTYKSKIEHMIYFRYKNNINMLIFYVSLNYWILNYYIFIGYVFKIKDCLWVWDVYYSLLCSCVSFSYNVIMKLTVMTSVDHSG